MKRVKLNTGQLRNKQRTEKSLKTTQLPDAEEHASRIELFKTDRNVLKQVSSLDIIEHILKMKNMPDEAKMRLIENALSGFITGKEQSRGATVSTPSGKPSRTQTVITDDTPNMPIANKKPTRKRKPAAVATDTESVYEDALEEKPIYPDLTPFKKAEMAKKSKETAEKEAKEMVTGLMASAGIQWNDTGNVILEGKIIPGSNINTIIPLLYSPVNSSSVQPGAHAVLSELQIELMKHRAMSDPKDKKLKRHFTEAIDVLGGQLSKLEAFKPPSQPNEWRALRK